jgi:DNA-binding response OmpR family regulator
MPTTHAMGSLILVEDNDALRQELAHYLGQEGFDVRSADGGEALNQALQERRADVLILDLNMAEEDGISIAKRIRKSLPEVRILMLTARVMSSDKLAGYESGADVYMTKPARPAELSAALKNLLLRLAPQALTPSWVLDTTGLSIRFGQSLGIALTSIESHLLKQLSLNSGCVEVERLQALLAEQHMDSDKFKLRLAVLISRLRSKISTHTGQVNVIKSVRGRGYQLCIDLALQ